MDATQRLSLPMMQPGQAQKELVHNEALQALDIMVAAAVEEPPRSAPPESPTPGSCYLVADAPTGEWASAAGRVAAHTAAGWRFVEPAEGMTVFVRSTAVNATYRAGAWEMGVLRGEAVVVSGQQVIGARRPPIGEPTGGATADPESRAAIGAILAALRQHGLIEP